MAVSPLARFHHRRRRHAEALGLGRLEGNPRDKLPQYRAYLERSEAVLRRYHARGVSGLAEVHARSAALDVLLEQLFRLALAAWRRDRGEPPVEVTLLALGGYGRSEQCPGSDIDIMFLYPDKTRRADPAPLQQVLNDIVLYMLWDCGLKVGHSTRTIQEALDESAKEVQSRNALMESRLLCGSKTLHDRFESLFNKQLRKENAARYIAERLEDQRLRRTKFGDTVFLQEPEIKNGVGGLRDYQNILWMVRLKLGLREVDHLLESELLHPNEHREFVAAYDFLLRVRSQLHQQSKRVSDLLSLDKQPTIALALGYRHEDVFHRVEAFMRDYYRRAQTIYRTSTYLEQRLALDSRQSRLSFTAVIQARRFIRRNYVDGLVLADGVLSAENPNVFAEDPVRLIRVFRHLQQLRAEPHLELTRLIEQNVHRIDAALVASDDAHRSFRSILQASGEVAPTLRRMNNCGVLSAFIPEWAALHCLVQHEYYHRYTADEHTLNTIAQLDAIFGGLEPGLTDRYRHELEQTELPSLLYLALLLHDIGKGQGVQGHCEAGAGLAEAICIRLGLGPELVRKVVFLVRHHLEMARFWQRHDIDDPDTVAQLANLVGDADTLRYLYALTFCDARGTTADLWNSYKETLHHQLFQSTLKLLQQSGQRPEERPMISKEAILEKVHGLSAEEIEAHFSLLPERYFIHTEPEEIALHLRMVNALLQRIHTTDSMASLVPVVEWQNDLNLGLTVVHIVTWDRAGLFYKLAGAFSVAGLSIVSSKALTRSDHITIDTFYVCEPGGGLVQNPQTRLTFEQTLRDCLTDNADLLPRILSQAQKLKTSSYLKKDDRLKAPLPPRVDVYHELSLRRTIIEIQANDAIGLLYRFAKAIYDHGFDITFARISTERSVAVDTFYIEPIDSRSKDDSTALIALREELNRIVAL